MGRPKSQLPCKIPGCSAILDGKSGKGFCRNHYARYRRGQLDEDGGELRPLGRQFAKNQKCRIADCATSSIGRGFCSLHYQRWKFGRIDLEGNNLPEPEWRSYYRPGRAKPDRVYTACKVDFCGAQVVISHLGFCGKHYAQHQRGSLSSEGVLVKELKIAKYPSGAVCKISGCDNQPRHRWFCNKHKQQLQCGLIDETGAKLREPKHRGRGRGKDRWLTTHGYVKVRAPAGHPGEHKQYGMILEHRLVMEQHLERYLTEKEVVHHINGIRDDNRIENLELCSTAKDHQHGHSYSILELAQQLDKLAHIGYAGNPDVLALLSKVASRIQPAAGNLPP